MLLRISKRQPHPSIASVFANSCALSCVHHKRNNYCKHGPTRYPIAAARSPSEARDRQQPPASCNVLPALYQGAAAMSIMLLLYLATQPSPHASLPTFPSPSNTSNPPSMLKRGRSIPHPSRQHISNRPACCTFLNPKKDEVYRFWSTAFNKTKRHSSAAPLGWASIAEMLHYCCNGETGLPPHLLESFQKVR